MNYISGYYHVYQKVDDEWELFDTYHTLDQASATVKRLVEDNTVACISPGIMKG